MQQPTLSPCDDDGLLYFRSDERHVYIRIVTEKSGKQRKSCRAVLSRDEAKVLQVALSTWARGK